MRDVLAQLAFDNQQPALELAAGCARFFDIEDSLSEELVEAELKATRAAARREHRSLCHLARRSPNTPGSR